MRKFRVIFFQKWAKSLTKNTGLDFGYFLKNGFWMMVRQVIELAVGILLFSAFARLTTEETLGSYQFVMAVFAVVSVVSIPGLNTSILREVSRGYDGEYVPAVRKSFLWSLLGIPVIISVGAYYYAFVSRELGIVLMSTSIFFPFFYAPNTWSAFLQGKCEYKKLSLYSVIQTSVNVLVTVAVLFFSRNNTLLIVSAYLVSYSALNIFYYYKTLAYKSNDRSSGEALEYGWFLTKINLFNFAAENVDKIVIGTLLSPVALAVFSVVSALPLKLKMIAKSVLSITFPKMSQDGFRLLDFAKEKHGRTIIACSLLLSLFLGAVYFVSVVPISRLFFGEKYSEYYFYGQYFALLVMTHIPLLIVNWYMQAKKMARAIARINAVSFAIRIVSLIVGVKFWGVLGGIWMYNLNTILFLLMHMAAIYIEDSKYSKLQPDPL